MKQSSKSSLVIAENIVEGKNINGERALFNQKFHNLLIRNVERHQMIIVELVTMYGMNLFSHACLVDFASVRIECFFHDALFDHVFVGIGIIAKVTAMVTIVLVQ